MPLKPSRPTVDREGQNVIEEQARHRNFRIYRCCVTAFTKSVDGADLLVEQIECEPDWDCKERDRSSGHEAQEQKNKRNSLHSTFPKWPDARHKDHLILHANQASHSWGLCPRAPRRHNANKSSCESKSLGQSAVTFFSVGTILSSPVRPAYVPADQLMLQGRRHVFCVSTRRLDPQYGRFPVTVAAHFLARRLSAMRRSGIRRRRRFETGHVSCRTCEETNRAAGIPKVGDDLEAVVDPPGIVGAEFHLSLQNKKGPARACVSICRFMPPCLPYCRCLS